MKIDKNEYFAIGVMSGTSLDGLDIALSRYYLVNGKWKFECIDTCFSEYSPAFKEMLRSSYSTTARELVINDLAFANFVGEKVNKFLNKTDVKIDLIASHGQTIFHSPMDGYTAQIGSGAVIASITGLPVISDFRQQDVTHGGQGAPLVPVGDALLFSEYAACLNLGGFANISLVQENKRIAGDICAVNFVLNRLAQNLGQEFDREGEIAKRGKLIEDLLIELNSIDFYQKDFPKSIGQEWVEEKVWPLMQKYKHEKTENLIKTYSEHLCYKIAQIFEKVKGNSVLVTGGGTRNKFIIEMIANQTTKIIVVPDETIIDFKEAIVFGFLGVLRFRNEINCYASVTGARKDSCTGALYMP
jgi:anhydro-N-acetylmuramic acid kinase